MNIAHSAFVERFGWDLTKVGVKDSEVGFRGMYEHVEINSNSTLVVLITYKYAKVN